MDPFKKYTTLDRLKHMHILSLQMFCVNQICVSPYELIVKSTGKMVWNLDLLRNP